MNQTFKRRSCYTRRDIAGTAYLLPFGQGIADHRRGMQLNGTSAFFWELLQEERTFDELLQLCAQQYQAAPDELPGLETDLRAFLDELRQRGLLEPSAPINVPPPGPGDHYLGIGGLVLRLCGTGAVLFPAFDAFRLSAPEPPHQTVYITRGAPPGHRSGPLLLRNRELAVMDLPGSYVLFFPSSQDILEVHLAKDASLAAIYLRPLTADPPSEDLFHAIRHCYLYLAQQHGILALHSASLLYRGKAWLFSGPSGTGKSTHTNLWNRLFQTPLLNGDLNLLALRDGVPLVYGLPWCGTSGISTPRTYPLGGIILLRQARENRVEFLPTDRRRLLAVQRLISPFWTQEQLHAALDVMDGLEPRCFICRLHCTPDPEAAWTARQAIDNFIASN